MICVYCVYSYMSGMYTRMYGVIYRLCDKVVLVILVCTCNSLRSQFVYIYVLIIFIYNYVFVCSCVTSRI